MQRATWTPPAPKVKRFSLSHAVPQPKIVAVKIINKSIPAEVTYKNELREAIQHELSIMPELDHPNIVCIIRVFANISIHNLFCRSNASKSLSLRLISVSR